MLDPPRPQARDAITRAHTAGIRVLVVTGDNGVTATEIARQVGIGSGPDGARTVTGDQLEAMSEADLDAILMSRSEIVFARSSPEAKLRIADALRGLGEVVAMTGDGVNDAPALRAADIGVAMGLSGTEVARQAATMVLTDDNFATIIDAVEEGRRVYDNVRKFILYIFTHAVPEIAPVPAVRAVRGRDPAAADGHATPGHRSAHRHTARPRAQPRTRRGRHHEPTAAPEVRGCHPAEPPPAGLGIPRRHLGRRSCSAVSSSSCTAADGPCMPPTGKGAALHHLYQQATTIAWLGIVSCQVGTAIAARTDRASLRRTGLFTNPLLLGAIGIELVLAAAVVFVPFLHPVFGTATPSAGQLAVVLPFPLVVWGADEIRRWIQRRRHRDGTSAALHQAARGGTVGTLEPRGGCVRGLL